MTAPRQSGISVTLRIIAGACAVLWLVGPVLCSAERISEGAGHAQVCAGPATPVHPHDIMPVHEHEQSHGPAQAHHHDGGEAQHEHGSQSQQGCDEKLCCSTMKALVPTAKPVVVPNPISQQAFVICLQNAAREHALASPNYKAVRQAKLCKWVFTPEVCLGPAFRSLAPPVLL